MRKFESSLEQKNLILQRWVVIAGLAMLLAKFAAYTITRSNAILTDALESIVNVVAGIIGLYSLQLSAKPRDADHPYGHGKVEFISASIEGAMIFFAGLILIGKSIYSFFFPQTLNDIDIGITIVAFTAMVNYILGYWCVKQGIKTNSLALTGSGEHLKSDAYSTLGIIVALILIFFTNYRLIDNLVAIGFGTFISITGYRVVRRALAGIMDEADTELLKKIISELDESRHEAWVDLHNMRVIKYGNVFHIDCHVTVPWYYNVQESHSELNSITETVKSQFSNPVELFIHTDPCVPPHQCKICILKTCGVREALFEKRIEWNLNTVLQNKKHGM